MPEQTPQFRIDIERIAWVVALLLAALARLPALGLLPLGLADSSRALAAWQVAGGRLPSFWSGDLIETLTAALFKLAGASDATTRLAPAVLGIGVVAAIWLYRPAVGRAAALLAAFFIALSPVFIAVSRSLSPYGAGALFALAAGAALLSFIETPRPAPIAWLAGLIGLGFSTDASFLVFLLAAVLFCLIEGLWSRREGLQAAGRYLAGRGPLLRSTALIGLAGLLVATTRFGIAPERLRSGAALSWTQAFLATAGAPPWHYPLDVLLAYEPFIFLAGLALAISLILRGRRDLSIAEMFLLYWAGAALVFVLLASRREAGQLPLVLAPLALLAATGAVRLLGLARWDLVRQAVAPTLLALPAFVYVLFVFESTAVQTQLSPGQVLALTLLSLGGVGLLLLGASWSRQSAPAYLTVCGLVAATTFAVHTLTRVGFASGDEFVLGPVATAGAPALGDELAQLASQVRGTISVDPSLAAPLSWYTRGNPSARSQSPTATSAAIVQPVDLAGSIGFTALIPRSEVARAWYPTGVDLGGTLRWLLYRQAWQPVRSTSAQVLVRSEQP